MVYAENYYSNSKAEKFRFTSRAIINTEFSNEFAVSQHAINSTLQKVAQLDFTPHGYKLQKEYGWSEEKINHTFNVHRRTKGKKDWKKKIIVKVSQNLMINERQNLRYYMSTFYLKVNTLETLEIIKI